VASRPDQPGARPAGLRASWSPFRQRVFTVLWVATVISNIGTWMQNAAAGWLMTSLDPDPRAVALVQAAMSLPMFLFSLPAGALADIVDRRRLLLVVQIVVTVAIMIFSLLASIGVVTPNILLAFIFVCGAAAVMIAPAWQAIVPQLVPREQLAPAIALNSVGVNISRAVGPALAGLIIAAMGLAAPFWLNAASNLAVIAALVWWHSSSVRVGDLPAELTVSDGLTWTRLV
jgi:MFS family permease